MKCKKSDLEIKQQEKEKEIHHKFVMMYLLIVQLDVQLWAKGFRYSCKRDLDLHQTHLYVLKNIRVVNEVVKINLVIKVIRVRGEMSSFTKIKVLVEQKAV